MDWIVSFEPAGRGLRIFWRLQDIERSADRIPRLMTDDKQRNRKHREHRASQYDPGPVTRQLELLWWNAAQHGLEILVANGAQEAE